jgi:hypothetical protein
VVWRAECKECLTMLLLDLASSACPDCVAGRAARALVFSDAFGTHLWGVVLPFLMTALIVRSVLRWVDGRDAAPHSEDRGER